VAARLNWLNLSNLRLGGIFTVAYLFVQTIFSIVYASSVGWFYIIWAATAVQYFIPMAAMLWVIVALDRVGVIRLNQLGLILIGTVFPLVYIVIVCNYTRECRIPTLFLAASLYSPASDSWHT
jgi:hypothetical protein